MNRVLTALALSGLFVAAPAFANSTHQGRRPAAVSKSVSDKSAGEAKTGDTKPAEGATAETPAKPAKVKKSKKAKAAAPAAPAAEGAPAK